MSSRRFTFWLVAIGATLAYGLFLCLLPVLLLVLYLVFGERRPGRGHFCDALLAWLQRAHPANLLA